MHVQRLLMEKLSKSLHLPQELAAPLQQAALRKVWCYPIQFAVPAPRPPLVEHFLDRDQTLLRYLGETQVINAVYLQKLVSDYYFNNYYNEFKSMNFKIF